MARNRQQRRHPTHPGLPLIQPSSEKVPVEKKSGKTNSKGHKAQTNVKK